MSLEQYVKASIANVEAALESSGQRLPSRCTTPIQANYRPELDTTAELKLFGIRYYQEMIGVLQWGIELGRIDIAFDPQHPDVDESRFGTKSKTDLD